MCMLSSIRAAGRREDIDEAVILYDEVSLIQNICVNYRSTGTQLECTVRNVASAKLLRE